MSNLEVHHKRFRSRSGDVPKASLLVPVHVLSLNIGNETPFEVWVKMLEMIAHDTLRRFCKGQILK